MELIESKDTDGLIDSCLSGIFQSPDSDSWYFFRYPDSKEIFYGEGICMEGLHPGFVLAPFDLARYPQALVSICATQPDAEAWHASRVSQMDIPKESTHRDVYDNEIAGIKQILERQGGGKTIAARAIVENFIPDFKHLFSGMLANYRNAFVFLCYTPVTGFVFGATPEVLLECNGKQYETMALAGTRKAQEAGYSLPWDAKNVEEQKMVCNFIVDVFERFRLEPESLPAYSRNAGRIEHICTPIRSASGRLFTSEKQFVDFLKALSPTPAVAGLPRDVAFEAISKLEDFNRGYYGGLCGLYRNPADLHFFVNLRSGRTDNIRTALFVGGGITKLSDAETEWQETQAKASTLLPLLRKLL